MLQFLYTFAAGSSVKCPLGGSGCDTGLPAAHANSSNLQSLLQAAFGVIGVLAVIMVVIGGLQFISAQGDPSGVVKARKVILYALVGLIIAVSAEAIVTFVIGKF